MIGSRAEAACETVRTVDVVVFDIGGVLLDWQPERVYLELIPDAEERRQFLTQVCTPEWNGTLDAGRPFDEACAELTAQHPDYAVHIEAWERQDDMIAGQVEGTAQIVVALRSAGVPLYLLTNMPADIFRARRERFEVLRQFDGAVVSGDEGVLKPSPDIFRLLTSRFGLTPARTLLIDDSPLNVQGAKACGFRAHHFVDAGDLAATLHAYGLL